MVHKCHVLPPSIFILKKEVRDWRLEAGTGGTVKIGCAVGESRSVEGTIGEGGDLGVHTILRVEHDGGDV